MRVEVRVEVEVEVRGENLFAVPLMSVIVHLSGSRGVHTPVVRVVALQGAAHVHASHPPAMQLERSDWLKPGRFSGRTRHEF